MSLSTPTSTDSINVTSIQKYGQQSYKDTDKSFLNFTLITGLKYKQKAHKTLTGICLGLM